MNSSCAWLFKSVFVIFFLGIRIVACATPPHLLDKYNVIWDSPSEGPHGSMPIGNGDIGANVWMEENGDLVFYISKTDSWGDNGRLLKVGRVRVNFSPSLLKSRTSFHQELDLKNGQILIRIEGENTATVKFWIDANHPVINIETQSQKSLKATAKVELWRTQQTTRENQVSSPLRDDPANRKLIIEPDTIVKKYPDGIAWYHRNIKSVGPVMSMKFQGLDEYPGFEDILLHRTFGAVIKSEDARRLDDLTLQCNGTENQFSVYVMTKHPSTEETWLDSINKIITKTEKKALSERYRNHCRWWDEFWNRSWIHASTGKESKDASQKDDAFVVTRAYHLQRFIDACGSRGKFPVKFNGSIFTVGFKDDPDDRRWGQGYWWQNSRLPYVSMPASGDFDLMQPLFSMYGDDIFPLCQYRTRKYFGFEGAYFGECMYPWGAVFVKTYGWDKPYNERKDPLQRSEWHKWEWVAGPELVFMMMDYCDYTQNEDYLQEKVIPIAEAIMSFFENYYKHDAEGKLLMHPSQACETWWECTNPMPEIAGLRAITKRLLLINEHLSTAKQRASWKAFMDKLTALPLRDTVDGKALSPAEKFDKKKNSENPELYAVFPFRHIALGNDNIESGINALTHRWDKGAFGWRQDDIFMAYLGLTDQAKEYLVSRAHNYDKNSRFPAFWGPNYNWVPDQDHGGVLMKAFQSMLMQADPYSQKIYLLPAWPEEWDVDFKLHAPYKTTVEGKVRDGKIEELKVTPDSRLADVVRCNK